MSGKEWFKYYVLKGFFAILEILPWWAISLLSHIFTFFVRLLGYRKLVILDNLKGAFPEKSDKELNSILRDFYHNFIYQILSSPKLLSQSPEDIKSKHFIMQGQEIFKRLREEGYKAVFLLMGHYGNWELFSAGQIYVESFGFQQEQIYRVQKSEAINRLMRELRGRFGSVSLSKDDAARRILSSLREDSDVCSIFAFIADQSPSSANVHYFTKFLSRETAFLTGAERLARRFKIPVVYMDVIYEKRGCYRCEIRLLSDSPQSLKPMELTEMYAKAMQKTILRNPSHWLWSHRRWKINPKYYPNVMRSADLIKPNS